MPSRLVNTKYITTITIFFFFLKQIQGLSGVYFRCKTQHFSIRLGVIYCIVYCIYNLYVYIPTYISYTTEQVSKYDRRTVNFDTKCLPPPLTTVL